jgi:hypothetical protein
LTVSVILGVPSSTVPSTPATTTAGYPVSGVGCPADVTPTPPCQTNCPSVPKDPWVRCGVLNHKGNTFYLRSHVIYGNQSFENLYV